MKIVKSNVLPALGSLTALLCFGCEPATQPSEDGATKAPLDDAAELRIATQQVGEASTPLYTPGMGLEPDYRARLLALMYNRIRMSPHTYGLVSQDGPALPTPPARLDSFMTEPGRWAARFRDETGCLCSPVDVGYSIMDMAPRENRDFVEATCCDLRIVDGLAQCASQRVPCDNALATSRRDRWARLNFGASRITSESIVRLNEPSPITEEAIAGFLNAPADVFTGGLPFFSKGVRLGGPEIDGSAIGVSFVESIRVPEECVPVPKTCGGDGICVDGNTGLTVCNRMSNPDCLGRCVGGPNDTEMCTVPPQETDMPAECNPDDYPRVEAAVLTTGLTTAPVPVLTDGIHAQFALTELTFPALDNLTISNADGGALFHTTPEGEITFAVHYYETNGDPIGTPQSIQVVVNGVCNTMTADTPPPELDGGIPAPYAGNLFTHDQSLTQGCYPYAFVAQDGVGFEYTYPTYGSLQAHIAADGTIAPNDDTCPIWTEQRVDLSCAPSPNECNDGDTRPCYTGLYGTQDNGACAPGVETCAGGRWTGSCTGQVLPALGDICHDGIDNDCNGGVDEDCLCNWNDSTFGVCFQTKKSLDRECVAPDTFEGDESTCDGLDNDCDGITDEGCPCDYLGSSEGVCATPILSSNGECPVPDAYEEDESMCDGLDNDCDGVIDEGCPCDYLNSSEGVCASRTRDISGACQEPETYEAEETSCDGRDNDCDGESDEDCASTCESSLDCRWEDGHGCEGRTSSGEKFCETIDGAYREERNAPATSNPECTDDADCNGVCNPYGLTCINNEEDRIPTTPRAASGDDLCGSPQDCNLGSTCESRDGIRQCIDANGEPEEQPGCGGCHSSGDGHIPTNLPLLGLFGLLMLRRRRRHVA